jgi:hypothetical protein
VNLSRQTSEMKLESRITDEFRLIPRWALAGALAGFLLTEYYFWEYLPAHRHHHSDVPAVLHLYLVISWGALVALYVLMIGYISNDAPRRGMSVRLWTICAVMPGGWGSVLYFLLRQPILSHCPSCSANIEADYHYCPQCAYQVSASCGRCFHSTRVTDLYCMHCGHDLASDHPPNRLAAFTRES